MEAEKIPLMESAATLTSVKVDLSENFKLAEALRDHCRDLLLLSVTPHQGDHFRFWMLIRLLTPELFETDQDMLENRHRLNAVVIRRTKADACAQDGSPLFSRRMVYTEGFNLSEREKEFYNNSTRCFVNTWRIPVLDRGVQINSYLQKSVDTCDCFELMGSSANFRDKTGIS